MSKAELINAINANDDTTIRQISDNDSHIIAYMIKKYIDNNKQRFLDELFELLRFPSVSADPSYQTAVLNTAEYVAEKLRAAGADMVEVCKTSGYPVVYGEKMIDSNKTIVHGNAHL